MKGIWTNDLFEYHGEFADFDTCGFGAQAVAEPAPPIYFSGSKDPSVRPSASPHTACPGWIGIQDSPEDIKRWRGEMERELTSSARRSPRTATCAR